MTIGKVRPAVAALAAYRPGKGIKQAEAEHGIVDAIKLASNENPYAPVPAVVAAVAEAASGVNRYADHGALSFDQNWPTGWESTATKSPWAVDLLASSNSCA